MLSCRGQHYIFTVLPYWHINSPALCFTFVCRELYNLSFLQDIISVHYSDDIMLIGPHKQEVVMIQNLLIRHLQVIGWKRDLAKIKGTLTSVTFWGVHGCGGWQDIPSKVKNKLLHLTPPTTRKEAQHLVGFFGFQRQHIPHSGVLLWPIYWVTENPANF